MVPGILKLAYKLLVNDRAKFTGLLVGITFAVFLMIEMTSLFAGVLNRSSSTVYNIGASIWVMDPAVNTVANTIGMPDYMLDAVRSIEGVKFAVPLYSGGALVRLRSGTYQPVTVVGIDDASLFGLPDVLNGRIEDIYAENAFLVVKDAEFDKLENPAVGTEFEINDNRGVIVQAGTAGYLQVLVADAQFHQADIGYLQARTQRLQDTVALFLALGGGWDASA